MWQGDPFSPDLVNINIDGLVKKIKRSGISLNIETIKLAILLYADDEILLADTPQKLLALMDIAVQYGKRWRQIYNLDKSMVVVFGKDRKIGRKWKFGDSFILEKKDSKYLGLELNRKLNWNPYKSRILKKVNNFFVALQCPMK